MKGSQIVVIPPANMALPPREERNFSQRIRAANIHWSNLVLDQANKSPMTGALSLLGINQIMAELIHDPQLLSRIEQYFETVLRTEAPKKTGELF